MNINGLDYMSLEFEFMETDLNAVECTLIVIVWILIQFLGNGLLLGLILLAALVSQDFAMIL